MPPTQSFSPIIIQLKSNFSFFSDDFSLRNPTTLSSSHLHRVNMTIFFAAISQDYEESFRLQDFFFLSTQCCRSILALFLSSINQIQQQDL